MNRLVIVLILTLGFFLTPALIQATPLYGYLGRYDQRSHTPNHYSRPPLTHDHQSRYKTTPHSPGRRFNRSHNSPGRRFNRSHNSPGRRFNRSHTRHHHHNHDYGKR